MPLLLAMRLRLLAATLLTAVSLLTQTSRAQTTDLATLSPEALYDEIARMDSVLFDAFNTRNLDVMRTMFTADLEFYHDKVGLGDYEQNMASFADLASQAHNDLRRTLVEGSLEVYPVPGYGAMQIGAHTFCHTEQGQQVCGTFQFLHVWRYEDGAWKVARVMSYDH